MSTISQVASILPLIEADASAPITSASAGRDNALLPVAVVILSPTATAAPPDGGAAEPQAAIQSLAPSLAYLSEELPQILALVERRKPARPAGAVRPAKPYRVPTKTGIVPRYLPERATTSDATDTSFYFDGPRRVDVVTPELRRRVLAKDGRWPRRMPASISWPIAGLVSAGMWFGLICAVEKFASLF